jgi:hypothetical protein
MTTKRLGGLLVALGLASILISFAGLQLRILWFLDEFGPAVGYLLKAGLVVVGFLIWKNGEN